MTLVREADLTDLAFILPLSRDAFSPYGHYDLSIAKWFLTPGTYTFVCEREVNGKVCCGFIMFALMSEMRRGVQDEQDGETVLEIMAIAVSKECRRQGIGTELIRFARQFNQNLAAGGKPMKIRLSVAETNQAGRSFFEKRGFRVVAEAPWRYPAGQKALRMEL
ncbi:MAG TPA: N-acetyltransferase [Proteobacteria bacterium]|nr:N-acetyltransferase [Pseudomonadota bacterium]